MRELDHRTPWPKGPIFALLAAGLVAGGAWEMVANAQPDLPTTPEVVAEPDAPLQLREGERLIPPPPIPEPVEGEKDIAAEPTFTPFTVAPSILNRNEVVEAMTQAYPGELRDQGVGGSVRVYFFIDVDGHVHDTRIDRSSGIDALDAAALDVASVYRFSPALNKNEPVPVWVSFPITFQVR